MKLLIGSTFPLSLIRRKVSIDPVVSHSFLSIVKEASIYSYWGHDNTLNAVNKMLGVDLAPLTVRPSLVLTENNLPILNGVEFNECWVVSPNYVAGFRPQLGVEVTQEEITGWEVLKIAWGEE